MKIFRLNILLENWPKLAKECPNITKVKLLCPHHPSALKDPFLFFLFVPFPSAVSVELKNSQSIMNHASANVILIMRMSFTLSGPGRDQGGGEGVVGGDHLGNGMMPNNKSKSTSQLSAGIYQSISYLWERSEVFRCGLITSA